LYFYLKDSYYYIFFFEISIFPIRYIILKWGVYPDRSKGVIILISFTIIFRLPSILFILWIYLTYGSFDLDLLKYYLKYENLSNLILFLLFIIFSVKLPLIGRHKWLPITHVEAPVFGSIILAGILLKLGGIGLIRVIFLFNTSFFYYFRFYLIIGYVLSVILCCLQIDFKKLIAYSSIFHIRIIPIFIISHSINRVKRAIILLFFHGIRSPLLFLLVNVIYEIFNTRLLILIRGLINNYSLLVYLSIIIFSISLPIPPFISFISEIYFIYNLYKIAIYLIFLALIGIVLSLFFNLLWLNCFISSSVSRIINKRYIKIIKIYAIFYIILGIRIYRFIFVRFL